MPLDNVNKPLVVIIGPTAVGKTDLAIEIAESVDGEIISADSRLFYRGMDIGTAKPDKERLAKIPHHLIDISVPDVIISLADFQGLALQKIASVFSKNKVPLLVGGTGQYIRAITEGWEIPRFPPDQELRNLIQSWANSIGKIELHRKLWILDPEAARLIDPSNVRRTIRALEVIFRTGKRFSELRDRSGPRYPILMIGLKRSRAELYKRIDDRIEGMVSNGLVPEVERLLKNGYSLQLPTISAIGYKEIGEYLNSQLSLEDAKKAMKRRTRIFVRRQANWFKESDPAIHWFNMEPSPKDPIVRLIRKHSVTRNEKD
jgi:tRNA dimethylallyltransferase